MAMDADRLADALRAAARLTGTDRDAAFRAMAAAIIYEVSQADVNMPPGSVTVLGVQSGASSATGAAFASGPNVLS